MRSEKKERLSLDALPDVGGCEKEDIACSMKEEADHMIYWIKDSILDKHKKETGNTRLSAKTRKLVQVKAYETYIGFHANVRRRIRKAANDLLSSLETW